MIPNRLRNPMIISTIDITKSMTVDKIIGTAWCLILVSLIEFFRRTITKTKNATTAKINDVLGFMYFLWKEQISEKFYPIDSPMIL